MDYQEALERQNRLQRFAELERKGFEEQSREQKERELIQKMQDLCVIYRGDIWAFARAVVNDLNLLNERITALELKLQEQRTAFENYCRK